MRTRSTYEVTVGLDGTWLVQYWGDDWSHDEVGRGKAKDQRHGELAARCAIEDSKANRAKAQIRASMQQSFSVKA